MRRCLVQLVPLAVAVLIVLGVLLLVPGGTVEFPELDPFVDEVSTLHSATSRQTDALWREHAEGQLSEAEAQAEVEAILSRHKVDLAALYQRHGRSLPAPINPPSPLQPGNP